MKMDEEDNMRGQDAGGPGRTAQAIRKIFRKAEPHFGQGLRKTFVNLGFKVERQRQYKAPKPSAIDKVALSGGTRRTFTFSVIGVLLVAIAWGGFETYKAVRDWRISIFEAKVQADLLNFKVRTAVEHLARAYQATPERFASEDAGLDSISLDACKTFLPTVKDASLADMKATCSALDKSSVEARLPLMTGMDLVFSFKMNKEGELRFTALRHEIR